MTTKTFVVEMEFREGSFAPQKVDSRFIEDAIDYWCGAGYDPDVNYSRLAVRESAEYIRRITSVNVAKD